MYENLLVLTKNPAKISPEFAWKQIKNISSPPPKKSRNTKKVSMPLKKPMLPLLEWMALKIDHAVLVKSFKSFETFIIIFFLESCG